MQGPNVAETAALARAIAIPVIASGGVSRVEEIAALKIHEPDGIAGAIIGRALYDGAIEPREALRVAS
jgi:phosphoribosylformimino-5-aminoimidazole carboxamide ribotide isomerase